MATYATVADYEARAAVTLVEPQRSQVQALLEDIAALIRTSIPAGTVPDPDVARAVSVAVARRTMANPAGTGSAQWASTRRRSARPAACI